MGSPNGWDVTISGRLVGLLLTASSSLPSASVSASARVVGGPAVNWGTITLAPDLQRAIDQGMTASSVLADGTYLVQGTLSVSADISAAGLFNANGRALSDFFAPPGYPGIWPQKSPWAAEGLPSCVRSDSTEARENTQFET